MSEYCWPEDGERLAERAREAWTATIEALPLGTSVTGEVVGRQPFGVFVRIDGVPDAVGLAEVTAMPSDASLPAVGDTLVGEVMGYADHNHQVRIRLVG
ncbi:hypothetical protein [Amycolatopsis regifaucium]|uniref:S1 motif domain-containing protein n=1 Tax=Amycolatopsis regifaucium TaxID=546365 RepID=A0A154MR51_9PSEU|nr:hypothetical protein [Amycolatopsis regifaucium]KZB86580.1 hypothetical protein AVL48_26435 [Amycolatopsis regifaucium]OKA03525.1 hypothetical protein ATP06_0236090 [Amycolatopsis regifaucium]